MRYATYVACLVLFLAALATALWLGGGWWIGVVVFGLPSALGTADLLQKRSTLRRNYPLLAHFRYGLESIGPEMRQYFIESDTAEVPFSRQQRALVYQRSNRSTTPGRSARCRTCMAAITNGSITRSGRPIPTHSTSAPPSVRTARIRIRPACSTSPR